MPLDLLRRVADERHADVEAERRLRRGLREGLAELAVDDIRRLAIVGALDGWGDAHRAVQRYGTESMRELLSAFRGEPPAAIARAELEPLLSSLRLNLWAPLAALAA